MTELSLPGDGVNHFVPTAAEVGAESDVVVKKSKHTTACGLSACGMNWRKLYGTGENVSRWVNCPDCLKSDDYLEYELQR